MSVEGVINHLVCPVHRCKLQIDHYSDIRLSGMPWPEGRIHCPQGCIFSVQKGIPRFVPPDNYANSFGLQWQRYQKTQLDSYTGTGITMRRLENSLDMPLRMLKGKTVLEVGCGAGRFTEHLIENTETLVSIDFSRAVDANFKNCCGRKPYLLMQADINASPLPLRYFDIVICLGVIQHTPSPEKTIESLSEYVKPGGLLVIDHYTNRNRLSPIGRIITLEFPLRIFLKRIKPELGLKATITMTAICDPIRKRTVNKTWLDRVAGRIFPSACCYNNFPELDPKIIYEWNELDTFDSLTCYYKHYRTQDEIYDCLQKLGFINIHCMDGHKIGGNGIVAHATYHDDTE